SDLSTWGILLMDANEVPEMDPYEEPVKDLEEDLKEDPEEEPEEDPEEDSKEDPIDYAADADDDKDEEEESFEDDDDEEEEHLTPTDSTVVASLTGDHVPSAEETEPFETDKSAATPPPPLAYRTTSRISIPSPPLPVPSPPTTSPTYTEAPLGYRAAVIRLRVASPLPLPALRDRVSLCNEVDTLRRYLSSLCTTHEQERVEARQALARSEAYNRALEAHIAVLETQTHRHEWQRQDADDHETGAMMRIQVLEA
ncbi:hypothetical protein Tco_1519783, partial [Tanacetum coccineum]